MSTIFQFYRFRNSFKHLIFEFLTIVLIFILVTILKILKTKSTTLSNDLFLWQVSKGFAVWSEFNIFCTLVTMATAAILNFFQPLKICHTLRWVFLQNFMKFDERNQFFLNPPFFVSMATAAKFVQPIPIFLANSRGCCSYQVSSISVWRVTCYDHFCVFNFF